MTSAEMTEVWPIMRSTTRHETITVSGVTGTTPPYGQHDPYQPHDHSGGWYTQPLPPPPPRRKSMSTGAILAIVFGAIAALCIAASIGVALMPTPKEKPVADGNAGTPAPYDTSQPTAAATGAPATSAPAAGPLTSFGDGTHEVGSGPGQIPPGTYTSIVPDAAFDLCFWSRLRGFSGEGKDIIAIGSGNAGDKQRVTIAATDKGFETKGCGTWAKA